MHAKACRVTMALKPFHAEGAHHSCTPLPAGAKPPPLLWFVPTLHFLALPCTLHWCVRSHVLHAQSVWAPPDRARDSICQSIAQYSGICYHVLLQAQDTLNATLRTADQRARPLSRAQWPTQLRDCDADLSMQDHDGYDALMHAAMGGHTATVVQLVTFVQTRKTDSLAGFMFAKSHAHRLAQRYAHSSSDALEHADAQGQEHELAAAGHVAGTLYL